MGTAFKAGDFVQHLVTKEYWKVTRADGDWIECKSTSPGPTIEAKFFPDNLQLFDVSRFRVDMPNQGFA
ncbi:MAG: hypothetical protein B7Z38_02530 [Rhodobacterales bacterium 12-64-8]|nr:MAG: hypothetical protein B7Z38_02530 [Rhodobacterales bacterium 12-64-8]OYX50252.1 MAG: hypothetical protein B7Y90_04540 [Alphaproteobacteria bacterium 32-64-14]